MSFSVTPKSAKEATRRDGATPQLKSEDMEGSQRVSPTGHNLRLFLRSQAVILKGPLFQEV